MYPVVTSQKVAETHGVICCNGSGKALHWNGIRGSNWSPICSDKLRYRRVKMVPLLCLSWVSRTLRVTTNLLWTCTILLCKSCMHCTQCMYVLYILCLLCISYTETTYFYIIQCMHCIYVIMLYFVCTYIAVLQFLLSKKPAKRKRAFIKDSDESGVSSHTCHNHCCSIPPYTCTQLCLSIIVCNAV